jgi:hypothetical protein
MLQEGGCGGGIGEGGQGGSLRVVKCSTIHTNDNMKGSRREGGSVGRGQGSGEIASRKEVIHTRRCGSRPGQRFDGRGQYQTGGHQWESVEQR